MEGAALGGGLVNYAKTYFTGALPEIWLFALGALFIVVTIFLPKGIIGLQVHGIKPGSGPYEVRWRKLKIKPL